MPTREPPEGAPPQLEPLVPNLPTTDVIPPQRIEALKYRLQFIGRSAWFVDLTGDEATIGWGDATIRVPQSPGLSRVHLRLFLRNNLWSFEDVSTNGVYELDALGEPTGQRVSGVNGWMPGRGYRVGGLEVWMRLVPSQEELATGFMGLIGESAPMLGVRKAMKRAGPSDATVVIHGQSGTGKELVALGIHNLSPRKSRDMISVNCGELEGDLSRSALFGYMKGAFTNAHADTDGSFHAADRSTLFLDEIGELPMKAQIELLRVLETGMVTRVGATKGVPVDVRVIAASHRHLGELVREGKFRDDLLARLDVITIRIPPLAERLEDIVDLLKFFSARFGDGRKIIWPEATIRNIKARPLNHNVRGIRNLVQRTLVLHPEITTVEPSHLEVGIIETRPARPTIADDDPNYIYLPGKPLKKLRREAIDKSIVRNGTKGAAQKELEVSESTLTRHDHDTDEDDERSE